MPKSRNRKKDISLPPDGTAKQVKQRAWVAPVMVACFLVGLVWIVTYYVAGSQIPGMDALGNWNIIVGMGLIAIGFVISTQWQ